MMRVNELYVDVKNPRRVEAVVVYRSWDEASDSYGDLYKSHISPFGPINKANIEAARSYIRSFQIGEPE